ncbi:hypothetical protein ACQKE0_01540 [Shewanella colwelliana]|uniref:hypothetical protein n=1 Tax=Shewanella colwelliana TaxID=23 RepID=UPI003D0353E2
MPLPVTVYRWDDAGAPSIAGRKPSDIISILKACLVDGYGDKQPLGWTIPYSDDVAVKAVFKNNTSDGGSGGYVQFSLDTSDTAGLKLRYQHAPAMTGLDDFSKSFNYNGLRATTGNDRWAVIGTSRAFYFIISRSDRPNCSLGVGEGATVHIGDIEPLIPTDQYIFSASYYSSSNDMSVNWSTSMNYTSDNKYYSRFNDLDGVNACNYAMKLPFTYVNQSGAALEGGEPVNPNILAPVALFVAGASSTTKDGYGVILRLSTTRPTCRGMVAGLRNLLFGGFADTPWPHIITVDGRDYWLVHQGHAGGCNLAIDLGDWYE